MRIHGEEGGYLLFSDIHNNRRMKYQPGSGVSLFLEPTNRANGLTRDLQGRLVACEHDSRRVTRQEADGSITVVASSFQGRRLNRPNDVVVRSDGCIYFTDPWSPGPAPTLHCRSSSIAPKQEQANGFHRFSQGEGGYDAKRKKRFGMSSVGH